MFDIFFYLGGDLDHSQTLMGSKLDHNYPSSHFSIQPVVFANPTNKTVMNIILCCGGNK